MTNNPLAERLETTDKKKIVTKEMLEGLVMRSNSLLWVKQSGKPYFLNKRTDDDGTTTHFLDRMI